MEATTTRTHQGRMLTIMVLGLLLNQTLDPAACAPTGPADGHVTILVRDADGNRLPMTSLDLFVVQSPAAPVRVADVITDHHGRVTFPCLDSIAAYVLQFHGRISIIVDGTTVGSMPMQAVNDQNAVRDRTWPAEIPGFPIFLLGRVSTTVRFVIGGTFADGTAVAAVPMFDLAEADDAPVRPLNPLTGGEMTAQQARTFHAVIGEPWGVARGSDASIAG